MFSVLSRIQRLQFLLIVLAALLYFSSSSMMLYLPKYVLALGGNEQQAGWLMGMSLLPVLLFSPFIGAASDRWGSKPLMLSGLAVYALGTLALLFVESVGPLLFFFRFIQGCGHALVFSPMFAAAARIIPPAYRAAGIGYFTVCIQIGNAVGSYVGDLVLSHWSFSAMFWASGCSGLFAMVSLLGFRNKHDLMRPEMAETSIDPRKPALFYGHFVILLMLGGVFGLAMQFMPIFFDFMLHEGWIDEAISNVYFMTSTLLTVAAVRLFTGSLSDGAYRRVVLSVCHVGLLLAVCALASIRSETSALVVSVIFGLSYGLLFPAVNAAIIGLSPVSERGKISGVLTMVYEFGFRGVPVVLGTVVYQMGYAVMFYAVAASYVLALCYLLYCQHRDVRYAAEKIPAPSLQG